MCVLFFLKKWHTINMSTKEKVLSELSSNKKEVVSGEALAQLCNVSRAAIWKAINSLRNEGYDIQGTTNGGYILNSQSDLFSKELLSYHFYKEFPEFQGNQIFCFKEIDSTNTYAKKLLSENGNLRNEIQELTDAGKKLHRAVIVAEKQTAGRGRSGRTFVSPEKTGIYTTIIYAPKGGITAPAKITAFSAVAICRVLQRLYNCTPSIKWINDIFLNGKKISGILTEGTANFETGKIEAAVIGIGINIEENPHALGEEVSKVAGAIIQQNQDKPEISRAELAANIAGEVLKILEENPSELINEYKKYSFLIGKEVEVHSLIDSTEGIYKATAVDITNEASLVVKLPDGSLKTLISGEVTLKSSSFVS